MKHMVQRFACVAAVGDFNLTLLDQFVDYKGLECVW